MSDIAALNDAEKGVADAVLPPALNVQSGDVTRVNSVADFKSADEKRPAANDQLATVPPLPTLSKDKSGALVTVAPSEKPAAEKPKSKPPPKKRASRWVRFKIWYNTYRFVSFT